MDRLGASRALASYRTKGDESVAARTAAHLAMQGWFLVGVNEPQSRWADAIRDLVAVDQRARSRSTSMRVDVAPLAPGSPLPSATLHVAMKSLRTIVHAPSALRT